MFKGGYKLIDFKDSNITLTTPTTITENTITLSKGGM